jgi:peptidase M28-like protein/PA domain-containing protein
MQRRHVLAAALCVVVGICVFGTAGAGAKTLSCDTQANDTPGTLLPCITKSDLQGYMTDLWNIAVAHPGPDGHPSRNSGEDGYWYSAQYVKDKMESWGYDVSLQQYDFLYTAFTKLPTFGISGVSPAPELNVDWTAAPSNGTITAKTVEPAGGIILPPTPTPTSSSGCTSADFTGFTSGNVALIQRGSCNFGVKVLNAQAAGASGVIIFNEGNPGRTGLQGINLVDANGQNFAASIPVISVTFALGQQLYDDYHAGAPASVSMSVSAIVGTRPDWNVIADSKGGDKNHTLVIDAHLDAIYGAGMLDNASGSVTILDIAKLMRNANTTNHLRFIWFGGEELGLFGSQFYTQTLSSTQASHIGYDLDADVTATPNYTLGILDPAAKDLFSSATTANTFPNRVYKASLVGRDAGIAYLDSQHQNHELFSPEGTDAYEFNLIGVPASGVLTGQDCCKTQAQVDLFQPNFIGTANEVGNFEGALGTSDGGCVDNSFRWCDNLDNNNFDVMTLMTRDFANMVLTMAYDTKVMSASGSAVINKKTALSQETGSRHIASS